MQRNLERETIEKEQVRAKLETEKEELTRNLSAREQDLAAKTQSERDAVAQLKAVTASLNALKDENEKLRNDVKTIQQDRDKQFDMMVKRTEELHAKVNELERAALTGAKIATADCVKSSELQFASDSDILRIFRWGRA